MDEALYIIAVTVNAMARDKEKCLKPVWMLT
jgi:hypothetical protein